MTEKNCFIANLQKKLTKQTVSKILLGIILFSIIIIPIIRMLFYIDKESLNKVLKNGQFYTSLLNSLTSTSLATLISVMLAYILAWAVSRTDIKLKFFFTVLICLPMLIPSVSHGMGLIILFGNNGIITRLLRINSSIYGFHGVVIGSVLYSFPVAFIMISDILKYEDQAPYEAAEVLGIPKKNQFSSITLPYLRKPLISVLFAVFTMIITDYGVTLSVGGKFKTLPIMLYEDAVGQLNYSTGSVIGMFLLIPAIIAFLFDLLNKDRGNSTFIIKKNTQSIKKYKRILAYAVLILISLFVITVLLSFCIQAFANTYPTDMNFTLKHFKNTFSKNGEKYLLNSILIAFLTSVIGVIIASATAYLTSRVKSGFSKALHLMAILSLAVPGLVLGLSYVIVFKKTFFYSTILILIMVNTVHFFASPYLMIYNAFGKMNENLEDVGSILGVRKLRIIKDVILPQSKQSVLEMFSYFFVNCMMTISAVSFLATPKNKPVSLLINQYESYNMMECAATVALLILVTNLIMKAIIHLIKNSRKNYAYKNSV